MNRPVTLASLAALLLMALPAPAATAAGEAELDCVEYLYVADYHWYYVCVDPKGGTCAVYFQERHGMTWTPRECLVPLGEAPAMPAATSICVPTNGGGLDYYSQACVNPGERRCLVSNEYSTDAGGYRRDCHGAPL